MGIANRGMAKWLEDFVQNINKSSTKNDQQEKIAEINVHDLEKVVWNDETFYVMFDDKGATILNEFANTVTTLQNVHTIQEVDEQLNSKQVVAEDNVEGVEGVEGDLFEEELKKVSTYLNDDTITDDDSNNTGVDTITADNEQPVNDEFSPSNIDEFSPTTQTIPSDEDTSTQVDGIENDINNVAQTLDMNEKIASLEEMVSELSKQVQTLIKAQEYAHVDPGNVYDNNSEQLEMQHVQDAIEKGQEMLDIEHSTDITTMEGRISLMDQLKNDISDIMDSDELIEIDPFGDENLEQPELFVDTDTEVVGPENVQDELTITEPGIEQNIEPVTEPIDSQPVIVTDEQIPEVPETEEIEETKEDDSQGDVPKMTTPQNGGPDTLKHSNIQDGIVKLNSKDFKIFTKQICPECGEQNLVKSKTAGLMVGIYCTACNVEYAVNTDTEEIFKNI